MICGLFHYKEGKRILWLKNQVKMNVKKLVENDSYSDMVFNVSRRRINVKKARRLAMGPNKSDNVLGDSWYLGETGEDPIQRQKNSQYLPVSDPACVPFSQDNMSYSCPTNPGHESTPLIKVSNKVINGAVRTSWHFSAKRFPPQCAPSQLKNTRPLIPLVFFIFYIHSISKYCLFSLQNIPMLEHFLRHALLPPGPSYCNNL